MSAEAVAALNGTAFCIDDRPEIDLVLHYDHKMPNGVVRYNQDDGVATITQIAPSRLIQ